MQVRGLSGRHTKGKAHLWSSRPSHTETAAARENSQVQRAFELARGMEAAAKDTADFQRNKIGYQGSWFKPTQGNTCS